MIPAIVTTDINGFLARCNSTVPDSNSILGTGIAAGSNRDGSCSRCSSIGTNTNGLISTLRNAITDNNGFRSRQRCGGSAVVIPYDGRIRGCSGQVVVAAKCPAVVSRKGVGVAYGLGIVARNGVIIAQCFGVCSRDGVRVTDSGRTFSADYISRTDSNSFISSRFRFEAHRQYLLSYGLCFFTDGHSRPLIHPIISQRFITDSDSFSLSSSRLISHSYGVSSTSRCRGTSTNGNILITCSTCLITNRNTVISCITNIITEKERIGSINFCSCSGIYPVIVATDDIGACRIGMDGVILPKDAAVIRSRGVIIAYSLGVFAGNFRGVTEGNGIHPADFGTFIPLHICYPDGNRSVSDGFRVGPNGHSCSFARH